MTTTLLADGKGVGSQEADLLGEVAHHGEQAGDEQGNVEVVNVGAEIAEAIPGPPAVGVVVPPDQGVDEGVEVGHLDVEEEDDGGELAVAVEVPQGHEADDVCEGGEQDAADEVGREGGGGDGFSFAGHDDPGTVTAEQAFRAGHDEGLK